MNEVEIEGEFEGESLETQVPEEIFEKASQLARDNSVYLSGPIRCVEDDGRGWRNDVIEQYGDEFEFHNPLDRYDPETMDILSDPSNIDLDADKQQVLPTEYVADDKRLMAQSEAVLLGLPEEIARGSLMEAMWCSLHQIPVYAWTIEGQTESGWLHVHAEIVSDDLDEVISEMRG